GGSKTIIIALTASAMDENKRIAMSNGVDGFLSKPCHEDELLQKIHDCMNLDYVYEDSEPRSSDFVSTLVPDSGSLDIRRVPPQLVLDLRKAIRNGETDRLYLLIEQVGQSEVE